MKKGLVHSLLAATAMVTACSIGASAQGQSTPVSQQTSKIAIQSNPADDPNLDHFYKHRKSVTIEDNSPLVRDMRGAPTSPTYIIEVPQLPASAAQPVIVVHPSSNAQVMNDLSPAGFRSNIPAHGAVANNLPPGTVANHVPAQSAPQAKIATEATGRLAANNSRKVAPSSSLSGPTMTYGKPDFVSSSGNGQIRTKVSGELFERGSIIGH